MFSGGFIKKLRNREGKGDRWPASCSLLLRKYHHPRRWSSLLEGQNGLSLISYALKNGRLPTNE